MFNPAFALIQSHPDQALAGVLALGCLFWLFMILAMIAFPIFCFWRIFTKTGQSGALSLLCLIPGIGLIIVLCVLAFGEWPVSRKQG